MPYDIMNGPGGDAAGAATAGLNSYSGNMRETEPDDPRKKRQGQAGGVLYPPPKPDWQNLPPPSMMAVGNPAPMQSAADMVHLGPSTAGFNAGATMRQPLSAEQAAVLMPEYQMPMRTTADSPLTILEMARRRAVAPPQLME